MVIPILVLIGEKLRKIPVLGKLIDERFLSHRKRAQRIAGLTGFVVADLIYGYRFFINHVQNWDLLAVVFSVAAVYLVLIIWYLFTE
jgi:uncharacterized membrane protein YhhN